MKQTAVDWLVKNLKFYVSSYKIDEIYEHAKLIEKQQIVDARKDGLMVDIYDSYESDDEYYNKTYGRESN
jgi:predicted amidohydrolase YtcJ